MKRVVVHTIGKVATNTLYNTIVKSCPDVAVHWAHNLVLEDYRRFFQDLAHLREARYVKSMREQAAQAQHITNLFRTNQVDLCLTCMRHPYDHVMSSIFHHARDIFPELFDDKLGTREKKHLVAKRIEDHFHEHVIKGLPPTSDPSRMMVGNMTRCFTWWESGFKAVHGLDVQEFSPQSNGTWETRHNGVRYVLLRMEDMRINLPKVVDMITPGARLQTVTGNISGKRPGDWGRVYNWFRTEYIPPKAMVEYYEQNPFTNLFYPERSTVAEATA